MLLINVQIVSLIDVAKEGVAAIQLLERIM